MSDLFRRQQECNESKRWLSFTDHIPVASGSLDRTLHSPTGSLVLVFIVCYLRAVESAPTPGDPMND